MEKVGNLIGRLDYTYNGHMVHFMTICLFSGNLVKIVSRKIWQPWPGGWQCSATWLNILA
jgi:hypothetical protein